MVQTSCMIWVTGCSRPVSQMRPGRERSVAFAVVSVLPAMSTDAGQSILKETFDLLFDGIGQLTKARPSSSEHRSELTQDGTELSFTAEIADSEFFQTAVV